MKTFTSLMAALVLTVIALVPAGAEDELLEPCSGDNVITVGSDAQDIDTPLLPGDVTSGSYIIDLSGEPVGTTASVDVILTWGDLTDFDLTANGVDSASFNPTDGEGETVNLTKVKHCGVVSADVVNFAGNPLTSMTLDLNIRNLKVT